jgi:four helix bundle protein
MRNFKELTIWQKAYDLALDVYKTTKQFPPEELYGLSSQMRRASVSIVSNIAEGCGRGTNLETAQFFHIAVGSASELHCQILLAGDLKYVGTAQCSELEKQVIEVKKIGTAFIQKLRAMGRDLKPDP